MNTFTEAEKLREEFYAEHLTENKTSIKSSPAEIADWWLSKLQAYKEYLIACGEGMKKEAPAENDIPI